MLPPLLGRVDRAVLTQPPSAPETRRWDPTEALAAVGGASGELCPVVVEATFHAALDLARRAAGSGTVVVTGSCHTVGDALREVGRVPFGMGPA